jgi:hypothetical protein
VVNANDFKTALTGGLWFEENTNDPAEVVYPYAVYSFYPGDADYDSADKWYDPIYVLTIYESGESDPLTLLTHGKKLNDRLVDSEASLTMDNYTMLSVDLLNTPQPDRTVDREWSLETRFRLRIEKK